MSGWDDSDDDGSAGTTSDSSTPTEQDAGSEARQSGETPGDSPVRDPVRDRFNGETDLQEIATWEPRSGLDRFAVAVTGFLRVSRWIVLVGLALLLFLAQLAFAGLLVVDQPLLGVLAILSALPALAVAGYFYFGDPTHREPLVLVSVTFLLAILFATFAAIVNTLSQPAFEVIPVVGVILFFFLVVAPVEEFVKWLAIRVFAYRSDDFKTVVDGVVYGAVAGLGFAAIENFSYILTTYLDVEQASQLVQQRTAIATAITRAFVGPGHVIFSAWAGFYLGLAKFNPENRGPIVVKGLLIAGFIHALYNSLVSTLPLNLLTFVVFIAIFHGFWFTILYRKVRRYQNLYDQTNRSML